MTQSLNIEREPSTIPLIGVGLRHQHFTEALTERANIDFVEVHSENFFADGGASRSVLREAAEKYAISLHSTAMGLGSAQGVPDSYLDQLIRLANDCNPLLMSDHICFTWSELQGKPVHGGDLLPLVYSEQTLTVFAHNLDRIQQRLGRALLVENLSAYIHYPQASMPETEFLVRLCDLTGCTLLLDLNNIIVTANNSNAEQPLHFAEQWLAEIPSNIVDEIHLAGYTAVKSGELVVDDHSQAVSQQCWQLYRAALDKFGNVPTLIEWDNNMPSWQRLLQEADKARKIGAQVFSAPTLSGTVHA